MVSLFVVNNPELVKKLPPGWGEAGGDGRHRVLRTTDGRVAYLLVCCDDRDLALVAERLATAMEQSTGRP